MAFEKRTTKVLNGSDNAQLDLEIIAKKYNYMHDGAISGVAVTVEVNAFKELPDDYGVLVNPGQHCYWHVPQGSKASDTFNVVLTPKDGGTAIAAGGIDIFVFA